jgi:hypothetical protein
VLDEPEQMTIFPLIEPGADGGELTVTERVCAGEVPQALLAVFEIFPLLTPAVALIKFVEEEPPHPPGKVHV